jgi:hypothetical protein
VHARLATRSLFSLVVLVASAGCTLVTGAGDYEVDAELEQRMEDELAMSVTRDLDFSFSAMDAHADTPLDVAVVNERNFLQARARIVMPRPVEGSYPTERLVMKRALTPGAQRLFFYADTNGDNDIQGSMQRIQEHIWVEPVPPAGVGTFMHSLDFIFFSEDDFGQNQDLVLERPMPSVGELPLEQVLACFRDKFEGEFDETFEVKVFFAAEDRQVGYFKLYAGGTPPQSFEISLPGIIDIGSDYHFEVLTDGMVKHEFTETAPDVETWRIPATRWLRLNLEPADCR